jgi:hypothetical protein
VDIRLFGVWATSMSPYIFAIVEERVYKGGSDGCKREAVGNGKRCGKEDEAVGLVSLEIDLRDVILLPCVIESVSKERQVMY